MNVCVFFILLSAINKTFIRDYFQNGFVKPSPSLILKQPYLLFCEEIS